MTIKFKQTERNLALCFTRLALEQLTFDRNRNAETDKIEACMVNLVTATECAKSSELRITESQGYTLRVWSINSKGKKTLCGKFNTYAG